MAIEEEAFPRGGGRTLTGLERKRLRHEAEAEAQRDFLVDWKEAPTHSRKRSRKVEH